MSPASRAFPRDAAPTGPDLPTPGAPEPDRVRRMFDRVAGRYDLLNGVLSLGVDRRWRRAAARTAVAGRPGARVLDLFTGTGDLHAELERAGAGAVVGLDFSRGMLRLSARKDPARRLVAGDAARLPFPDGSFDVVTGAFGLRNVLDRARCLAEVRRVLRPGGRLVLLEFRPPPRGALGAAARLWCEHALPRLARWLSSCPEAYRYLTESAQAFPCPERWRGEVEAAGFHTVTVWTLFPGNVQCLSAAASPSLPPLDGGRSAAS